MNETFFGDYEIRVNKVDCSTSLVYTTGRTEEQLAFLRETGGRLVAVLYGTTFDAAKNLCELIRCMPETWR